MKKVFVSAFALLASLSLWAQDVTTIYNEAAADYGAKNFASAAAKFEQVIDLGIDTPVDKIVSAAKEQDIHIIH